MEQSAKRKHTVNFFFEKGILINPTFLEESEENPDSVYNGIKDKIKSSLFLILNKDIKNILESESCKELNVNWRDLDRALVELEKRGNKKTYEQFIDYLNKTPPTNKKSQEDSFELISRYKEKTKKIDIQDFVSNLMMRYK